MNEIRSAPAATETNENKLRQLETELRASQRQIVNLLELINKQQEQLNEHSSSIVRLDRILMEILTGRTWRTLRAAGEIVKRFVPSRSASGSTKLADVRSYLVCDEPKSGDRRPRSGNITVRGWCLAERRIDLVHIEVEGLPRIETSASIARPDVRKLHPDLDRTGRSGFQVEFDSHRLPNGTYTITVRAFSAGTALRETETSVLIDHERGFSSDYDRWIKEFERPEEALIELKLPSLQIRPLISVLMPVYNTEPDELKAAIESVLNQTYGNWELCIADDCSSRAQVREILREFARRDERIKLDLRSEQGGISAACNSAWALAGGDYITFLDHDDAFAPHALAYVCEAVNARPESDLIYSDEDKIDPLGTRFEPFLKPDWSPDLLLSENYICHLLVLRRDLASAIGSFNSDCDGSQDYDLILRAISKAKQIHHIPHVLYHWRAGVASTASTIENKQYALDAARLALERHCVRSGTAAGVQHGLVQGRWRVRYPIPPDAGVSIIIPSGGKADVLRTNLTALFAKTSYADYEVVVVDNSKGNSIERLLSDFQPAPRALRYIDWRNQPFNYSVINNAAARQCESPFLLFLNDDTSVITSEWLEALVELIARPEVGAVGAKLLYPDGRIQHAGVVMGLYDNCGHAFKGLDAEVSHYFDFSDVIRNVSAVTGACLMTKSDVFIQVGGFDEDQFAVAFNDIDLCLKIGALGYRVLYTPHAQLYHHEAFSKTSKDLVPHPQEVASMRAKWEGVIASDPYYNPNLTRNDENFSLRTRA